METVVSLLPKALALFGLAVAAYWFVTKAVGPVASKGLSLFTVVKADFAALEARVVQVETQLGIVKPQVAPVPAAVLVHQGEVDRHPYLPEVNTPAVQAVTVAQPKQESSMETVVSLLPKALALFGALVAVYWIVTKAVGPVASKGLSLFTVVKADFAALEARVVQVETQLGIVKPASPAAPAPVVPPVAKAA